MFSIKAVCAATGIHPVTLRAWERRYGLLEPQRTPAGHRLYTEADVERIRRVLALTSEGVSIGQVREALAAQPVAKAPTTDSGPWPGLHRRMAAAIAAFDEPQLESIYAEALALHPVDAVDRMLLMPLLKRLGERWGEVAGGVAEEHFFLAYVRHKIGARFHHRRVLSDGPKILAACAPGELHEIGLLLFALAAHDAGFRVVLLGANVPFREAAAAALRARCDAVVISNAIDRSSPEFYAELAGLVAAGPRVYVGGSAVVARATEVEAAGAVPLTSSIESAVRRLAAEVGGERDGARPRRAASGRRRPGGRPRRTPVRGA